jgi:VWFA-related protein
MTIRSLDGDAAARCVAPWLAAFALAVAAGFSSGRAEASDLMAASPQTPSARVRILSPVDGAFVVGPTRLRAEVEPPDAASRVIFFVDGLEVCTVADPPFECEWDAGTTITQHLVRVVVNLAAGGRIVRTTRTAAAEFAETVDVDVVKVTVTVTDERGRYIKGLPQSAFRVSEDGRPQTISHFFPHDAPLELVVAVDMSESMALAVPTLKKAVSNFLGAVAPRHAVTLLGFNDDVFTLARRAGNAAERVKAVEAVTSWGTTVLYDVILHGADLLDAQTGRKALVVFTDGHDSRSYATIADVERRLQTSDLTLYMIGQGQGITNAPLKELMERLSRPTGGRAFFTERIDELQDIFGELLEELSQQYGLGYQPTNRARDDTWRQIKVEVEGQPRVRARQGYRAASSSIRRR